jgi:hypothetical protein
MSDHDPLDPFPPAPLDPDPTPVEPSLPPSPAPPVIIPSPGLVPPQSDFLIETRINPIPNTSWPEDGGS